MHGASHASLRRRNAKDPVLERGFLLRSGAVHLLESVYPMMETNNARPTGPSDS